MCPIKGASNPNHQRAITSPSPPHMGCVLSDSVTPINKHEFERSAVKRDVNMVDPPRMRASEFGETRVIDAKCSISYQKAVRVNKTSAARYGS